MHNLVSRACWLFDTKEGTFLLIRMPRDSENKVAIYKQIDRTHVDGIEKRQKMLL